MESSAESCRLYLVSPPYIDHPTIFAEELRAAFAGGDMAAFLLGLADADEAAIAGAADTLRPICQQRDAGRSSVSAQRPRLCCPGYQSTSMVCSSRPSCIRARA